MRSILFVLLLLFGHTLIAQDLDTTYSISTDRPCIGNSATLMKKGWLQIESGVSFARSEMLNEETFNNTWTSPDFVLRYGVTDRFELRLNSGINGLNAQSNLSGIKINQQNTGLIPVGLGLKARLLDEVGFWPELTVQAGLNFGDLAGKAFQFEHNQAVLALIFNHNISSKSSINYNLYATWQGNSQVTPFNYSLAYSYVLSSKIVISAEVFGNAQELQNNYEGRHSVDAGMIYLLSKRIQLDAFGGYQLTNASIERNYFMSLGFSVLMGKIR